MFPKLLQENGNDDKHKYILNVDLSASSSINFLWAFVALNALFCLVNIGLWSRNPKSEPKMRFICINCIRILISFFPILFFCEVIYLSY